MIAIDMEMPKSCEECPMMFMHLGQIEKYCRITKEVLGTYRKKNKRRPASCPLIDLTDDGK